ncbi:MAG: hypothetical protein JEY91_02025 [Spirochaetaceae bacterium]|nr:hypothetical protein [Spirochaetaceae bacterium]
MRHPYKMILSLVVTLSFWGCMSSSSPEENNSDVIKQSEITKTERDKRVDEYVHIQGTLEKITKLGGTLSEYSYYVIRVDLKETILFNEDKISEGFESFVKTEVHIKGLKTEGSIGWRKMKAMGLQVLEIEPLS